jgi:hypothetical protein
MMRFIRKQVEKRVGEIIYGASFRAGDCNLCGGAVFASFRWQGTDGAWIENGQWWQRAECSRCGAAPGKFAWTAEDRRRSKR